MKKKSLLIVLSLVIVVSVVLAMGAGAKVTLVTDGGTNDGETMYLSKLRDVSPTKAGYEFEGWRLEDGSPVTLDYFNGNKLSGKQVFASWAVVNFTITYHLNGGTNNPANPESYNINSTDVEFLAPIREGYDFRGWYDNKDFYGSQITSIPAGSIGNIEIFAKWNYFDITYNNVLPSELPESAVHAYDGTAEVILPVPVRTGYAFRGWYDNPAFSGNAITRIIAGSIGNKVYYAKWELASYSITYKLNGGTHEGNPSQINIMQTVELNPARRSGYRFLGWYIDEGEGEYTNTDMELSSISRNITLVATWQPQVYVITYYLDGGTNNLDNPAEYDITLENDIILTAPTKEGFEFEAWKDAQNSVVTRINKGSTGNISLYAVWSIINYRVTYVSNGGTTNPMNLDTYNVLEGLTLQPITRADYVFQGWYLNDIFSGAIVTSLPIEGAPLDNVTLYAKFSQAYPIQYVLGENAVNDSRNAANYTRESGAALYPASRLGYDFEEWNTSPDGTGDTVTQIPSGSTGTVRLYAIWAVKTYSISYNLNGGSFSDTPVSNYTVEDTVSLPEPEKTGYDFVGWFATEQLTDTPIPAFSGQTGNKVFYAKWSLESYEIIYNGMEQGSNNNPQYYTYEDEINLVPAVRTGYEFMGWYSEGTYENLVTSIPRYSHGTINLYARFVYLYAITYELYGGALLEGNPSNYTGLSEVTLGDASRAGHRFYGWYDNADFEGERIYVIPQGTTGAIKLYAKFAVLYTVSYNFNGGSTVSNPASYTALDAVIVLTQPTRKGANFAGWKNDDGTEVETIGGGREQNLVLTAQWEFIRYDITYHLFGGTNHENNIDYFTYDTTVQLGAPSKENNTFRNWYLDEAFTQVISALPPEGEPRNIDLYAKFVPNNEIYRVNYTDIFDADNRNNPSQYTSDSTEPLLAITRPGYNFLYWEYNGNPIETLFGKVGDITIKAVWSPIEYSITFMTDGGEKGLNPDTYNTEDGLTLVPGEKLHYDFYKWYLDEAKTQAVTVIAPGTLGDITLYASWTLKNYTISYDLGNDVITHEYYTFGEGEYELTPGVKDAATFVSWHTDAALISAPVTSIPRNNPTDVTFYAKWVYTEFTIRYELNGGTYNPAPQYKKTSYTVEDTVMLQQPVREGYTFVGWYVFDTASYPVERLVSEKKYAVGYIPPTMNYVTVNNYFSQMAGISYPATAITPGNGGNRVFYAKWSSESYNVAYSLDGGINSSSNPATYTKDDNFNLYGATREGYTFIGWYRTADFQASSQVTKLPVQGYLGNIQLFARFEKTYTINYNLDSNSGFAASVPTTYNRAMDTIMLAEPQKVNHLFFGWYTNMTYTNEVVSINNENYLELSNPYFIINLYPKFLQRYEIIYNLYSGENSPLNPSFYTEESNITLQPAEKEGYYFKGWYTNADATLGRLVTAINSSDPAFRTRYTLHAIFLPITYVNYVSNGGENPAGNPTWFTSEHNYGVTLLDAVRTGYDFMGWYATSNFTTDRITTLTNASITTLYARWQPKVYTITYSFAGELVDTANPSTYTIETETFVLQSHGRNDYNFNGWYSGETVYNQITKGSYGDLDLEARYTPINYTATYNLIYQGATHSNVATFNIESPDIPLTDASLAGATFKGWYDSPSYTGQRILQIASGTTSNRVFYAKWSLTPYTITYELDGGFNPTTGTLNPTTYNISETTAFVAPTKPSYTFLGWYLNPGFTGEKVVSVVGRTGDLLLYARFETTYFINYNLSSGAYPEVNHSSNPPSFTVSSPTIVLGSPTKTYFEFAGWYANPDFTGSPVTQITTGTTGTVNLYPKWMPIDYTITYVLNGASSNVGNPSTYNVLSSNISLNAPLREGCTFGGWFLEADLLTGITIIPQGSNGNRTVYAKWNLINYPITYLNLEGATNNPSNLLQYNVETRELTLLPAVKTGYDFVGWYDESLSGYRDKILSGSYGAVTLTAHWTPVVYDIEYVLYNGTNHAENPLTYTIESSYLLKSPTRAHYTFDGWYNNPNFTGERLLSITATTGNKTIYAKWIAIEYDIVYILGGGANHLSNPATYNVERSVILRNASLAGSNFLGWYTEPGFSNKVTTLDGFTGTVILYARFSTAYTITYNLNGGINSPLNPSSYTVVEETVLDAPQKAGYRFDGWYTNQLFTGESVNAIPAGQTGPKVFYAKFVRVYTITYYADGGTHTNPATYEENTQVILTNAAKSAFIFLGWYENANFEGSPVSGIDSRNENIILYAKWGEWKGYMYYGSYPQSKVTDGAIIVALDTGIESGAITSNEKGYYTYGGEEYALVVAKGTGGYAAGERCYFKVEPIRWKILAYNNGQAVLIADTALEAKNFNSALTSNAWTTGSLKDWLETLFFGNAFAIEEQDAIVAQGSDSISLFDAGDLAEYETFSDADSRKTVASDYAVAQGAITDTEGNCYWWLSSSGLNSQYASYVGADGKVYGNASVILETLCVRPVIIVQLA